MIPLKDADSSRPSDSFSWHLPNEFAYGPLEINVRQPSWKTFKILA
jgi:hypothetical protein